VNPLVVEVLRDVHGIDASGARSKSWEELRDVPFDFVITVCDRARESCPVWAGGPVAAHWSSEDPDGASTPEEERRLVRRVAQEIRRRVELFCALPVESLDRARLEASVRAVGDDAIEKK
jgi:arsenate reductase (thioredoxin)